LGDARRSLRATLRRSRALDRRLGATLLTRRGHRRIIALNLSGERVADDLELLKGTLDILVLKALTWGPRHGYAVARWIGEATSETLGVEEGALYHALHRLERQGWVESEWGVSETNRRAKYYTITRAGRQQLAAKSASFTRYANAVFAALATA
jgi:PadR family transcriptional regulator, regulatory protein PadR